MRVYPNLHELIPIIPHALRLINETKETCGVYEAHVLAEAGSALVQLLAHVKAMQTGGSGDFYHELRKLTPP